MKTKLGRYALISTFSFHLTAFSQGSLTPPGAPAPMMKTLAQIEPRTPISAAPFTIVAAGSYYLTTNLTVGSGNAITIATNGVALDLGDWTITSTAASALGYGILLNSGLRDLAIFNGHIVSGVTNNGSGVYAGSGFGYGISYNGSAPANARVTGVSVSGCLYSGIDLAYGNSTLVESCVARTVGNYGIDASTIKGSVAEDCGIYAIIGDQVSDCRGEISGNGSGVFATTANNCYGSSTLAGTTAVYAKNALNCSGACGSSGYGILATGVAENCSGSSVNGGDGVYAGASALNCYGTSTGTGNGVYTACATSCYGSTTGGGTGVYATYLAQSCYGVSTGNGSGIYVATLLSPGHGSYGAALNCVGTSAGTGTGLTAVAANNCTGTSGSGTGLSAATATSCVGVSSGSGSIGLQAFSIAIGCIGNAPGGGTGLTASIANSCVGTSFSVGNKYNMP